MSMHRKIELITKSTARIMEMDEEKTRNEDWWTFMRRETWIHLKRSWELWLMVLLRKK